MRKVSRFTLVSLLAAALMFSGCASFKNAFCSPAATLVSQAVAAAAQIAALQTVYAPATMVGAALSAVLPKVNEIKNGYCVSDQDNFLLYVQQLITGADAQAVATGLKTADGQKYVGLKALGLTK